MTVDIFLRADGVTGESKDSKHAGWTEVKTLNWGAAQPSAMHTGGGGGAGKVSFSDLTITAYMDKATPALMKYCANGKPISKVEVACCKSGGSQIEFARITLEEVMVTTAQLQGADPKDPAEKLLMSYSFQAARVRKQYWEQAANGAKGAESNMGWNIKENCEV